MKKLLIFGAISSVLLTGCPKDGNDSNTTVEEDEVVIQTTVIEDQENIQASLSEIVSCMGTMKDGDLMTSFVEFAGLSNGEALDEEFVETLFESLDEYLETIEFPEEDRFPFETLIGTWSYDIQEGKWNRTKTPNNKIILEFPSSNDQTQNDVVASLSDYIDNQYYFDMEDVWLPKSFELSIKKNGTELAGIDLNNLSLEQSNDMIIPTNVDGSIFLAPFTLSMDMERTTTTEFTAEMNLEDAGGCGYGVKSTLKLKHDDYENMHEEDFTSIEGYLRHNNMKMQYFIGLSEIAKLINSNDDFTSEDFNSNVDVKVLINDQNIGELSLQENTNYEGEVDFIITYKDGTSEDASRYYEPFFDDLEAEFEAILGDWDELVEEEYYEEEWNDEDDEYTGEEWNGEDDGYTGEGELNGEDGGYTGEEEWPEGEWPGQDLTDEEMIDLIQEELSNLPSEQINND